MTEWIVRFEGLSPGGNEDLADGLVESLAPFFPAVSIGQDRISVTMTVSADTPQQAVAVAATAFSRIQPTAQMTRIEAAAAA